MVGTKEDDGKKETVEKTEETDQKDENVEKPKDISLEDGQIADEEISSKKVKVEKPVAVSFFSFSNPVFSL